MKGMLYCVPGLGCWYASRYRTHLREKYSLPGTPGSDFGVHCLCGCCALAQEFQELKAHRPSEGAELQSVVNPGWTRGENNRGDCVVLTVPLPASKEQGECSATASLRPALECYSAPPSHKPEPYAPECCYATPSPTPAATLEPYSQRPATLESSAAASPQRPPSIPFMERDTFF